MIIKVKVYREIEYETKNYYIYCKTVRSAFKTAYRHLRALRSLLIEFKTSGTMEAKIIYGENTIILKLNPIREIAYRRGSDAYWTLLISSKEIEIPLKTRLELGLYHIRRISHGKKQA